MQKVLKKYPGNIKNELQSNKKKYNLVLLLLVLLVLYSTLLVTIVAQ